MSFEGLHPVPDATAGEWIAPRLRGFGGQVHSVVPSGFAAYARILHPAQDEHGEPVSWTEVCGSTGRTAHGLMQWHSIAGVEEHVRTEGRWPFRHAVTETTSEWPGHPPQQGDLPAEVLAAVLDVLAASTADDADCYHAVWEGWGWLHEGSWGFLLPADDVGGRRSSRPPEPAGLPAEVMAGPRLRLPGRDYVLFHGPLRAALRVGHQVTRDWFSPQSPSLLWPGDRSWCLATEIDFDSTLVGGPQQLVDALVGAPGLEAWPVEASDDLTYGGDTVNR